MRPPANSCSRSTFTSASRPTRRAVSSSRWCATPIARTSSSWRVNSATLSEKARLGKLVAAEMQGGCFTVSSLGGIGGTAFTPIINAPEVAILGVSRASQRPVYQDGAFVPRLMLPLSLSYDHRVIDGADAVRFTSFLGKALADVQGLLRAHSMKLTVTVPDLGGFKDVAVIDVLVKPGQAVEVETPLITVESDKATMDIPSTVGRHGRERRREAGRQGQHGFARRGAAGRLGGFERPDGAARGAARPGAVRRGALPRYRADAADAGGCARDACAGFRGQGGCRPRCCRQARPARLRVRSRRAGRRSRRLYGRVPRRRPRPARRAGRALADAGRRLPQCRLHPVQGAAARGAGHRGCAGDVGARRALRRSADRCGEAARLEGFGRRPAHGRAAQPGAAAQGDGGAGHGVLHLASRDARGRWRGRPHGEFPAVRHRRRLGVGATAGPAGRPAHHRLDRSARTRPAREHAGDRRRHHRPRDGDRVCGARRQGQRRGADGRAHAGLRP